MKRNYLFLRENRPLDVRTVVYVIAIGESEREQRYLSKIREYANRHGATFRLWDESVDFFLDYERDRVFSGTDSVIFGFHRAFLDAATAAKLCHCDEFQMFEENLTDPKTLFIQMGILYPYLSKKYSPKNPVPSPQRSRRKNLSSEMPLIAFV